MCGIAGVWEVSNTDSTHPSVLYAMRDSLRHRGPDQAGFWSDERAGIHLLFRRLAILDLSENAQQPMTSPCGRFVIVFNGEIYNYEALREEIEASGHYPFSFRSRSDTEVLLAALSCWGIDEALKKVNGMFAFALWDPSQRSLTLARDRFGEKPLYYYHSDRILLFGSELKALREHPACPREIDSDALAAYCQLNYVPAPLSIYRRVSKLLSAHWVTFRTEGSRITSQMPQPYWSAVEEAQNSKIRGFAGSLAEAAEEFEALFQDSVRLRMRSDVPVGAFLSGGIDSTLVVEKMRAESQHPVRTFTIGFSEPGFDEAPYARSIARQLGTQHEERVFSDRDLERLVPRLTGIFDEPFADASQIPTLLLSQQTREKVTVALSGDGGDELFGGYYRHQWLQRVFPQLEKIPASWRAKMAKGLNAIPPAIWESFSQRLFPKLSARRLRKLAGLLGETSPEGIYGRLMSVGAHEILRQPMPSPTLSRGLESVDLSPAEWALLLDAVEFLQDDLLVKLDRSSMSASLESRVPFLDPRLFAFAWRLPLDFKISRTQGKVLLRHVLEKKVPKSLWDRPKMGFEPPIARWLRGPLRAWAENLLSQENLSSTALWDPSRVARVWAEHQSGQISQHSLLWNALLLQHWLLRAQQARPERQSEQRLTALEPFERSTDNRDA